MKRRLICVLLVLVMLAGMLPALCVRADEAPELTTSEKAIRILKQVEGFSAKAYYDHGQYSIGYGTACEKNEYPNGVTEEEADYLMRVALAKMEVALNKFVTKYSLNLSPNQYDALMMFTYNLGSGWTTNNGDFRTAVINGATGNEFIYYITRWCKASEEVSTGLIKRRLAEADLYLYGYYAKSAPANYCYVIFDGNGGVSDSGAQGYDACYPDVVRAGAENTGYRFMGWYTAAEGGRWVSHLDTKTHGLTLYAHWQQDEGEVDENGNILGTKVNYTRTTSALLKAYDAPSTDAEEMEAVPANTTVTVVADYVDAAGVKWGMLEDYTWIVLTDTTVTLTAASAPERVEEEEEEEEEKKEEETKSVQVMVTAYNVNYRSGPGTENTKLGTVSYGKYLTITEVTQVGTAKWGKFSNGWICLTYTNYDAVMNSQDTENSDETVVATGKVIACSSLRIRSGPGTGYSVVGTLASGTKVEVYEIKAVGTVRWGRIASGWISLNYVDLQTVKDEAEEKTEQDTDDLTGTVTGTVTADRLNVRSGAGTQYKVVDTLTQGTAVTVTQRVAVGGMIWGKTEKGWICMSYVKLTGTLPEDKNEPEEDADEPAEDTENTTPDPEGGNENVIVGTVTATSLRVRSGPGTGYDSVASLSQGTQVTVTEQKLVKGQFWGKVDNGWVCMSYVKITSGSSKVEFTGMITASALSIRSAAGTTNAVVGRYVRGTVVTIFEIATVSGVLWGRTDKGWICMEYVSY